jgi:hypothetical protein
VMAAGRFVPKLREACRLVTQPATRSNSA